MDEDVQEEFLKQREQHRLTAQEALEFDDLPAGFH
jgi:hypothetical protein